MPANEPFSLAQVRDQLRERLVYLEGQIRPLEEEAAEIRDLLAEDAGQKATTGRVSPDKIKAAVHDRPGLSGKEYADALGVTQQTAVRHLKALTSSGEVRREGQGRSTTWHPA